MELPASAAYPRYSLWNFLCRKALTPYTLWEKQSHSSPAVLFELKPDAADVMDLDDVYGLTCMGNAPSRF